MYLLVSMLLPSSNAIAQDGGHLNATLDSIDISLITCGQGDESYSLYGHTAIRINDKYDMRDIVANYGLFSFEQKNFVLRFIFGLTDYMMGITSFIDFIHEYQMEGRWVKEQLLDLTPSEKESLILAIIENSMPENAEYRYNFFYDNCTTRARDMIVSHIKGKVNYSKSQRGDVTYRDMIHAFTKNDPWTRFGNDLLLGVKADAKTDQMQQQFLPTHLFDDFSDAKIVDEQGQTRKLVMKERQLLSEKIEAKPFPITPMACMIALAILVCLLTAIEWFKKVDFWIFDVCMFLVLGLAGLILTAMLFSQHPTVRLNLQILLLNPIGLVGLVGLLGSVGGRKTNLPKKVNLSEKASSKKQFWNASAIYGVATIFVLLFLIGAIWQTYAEGLIILALSLLLRYSMKWKISQDKGKNIRHE